MVVVFLAGDGRVWQAGRASPVRPSPGFVRSVRNRKVCAGNQ